MTSPFAGEDLACVHLGITSERGRKSLKCPTAGHKFRRRIFGGMDRTKAATELVLGQCGNKPGC